MELGFMDMMKSAAIICDDCLKAKPGEKIAIVADSRNHESHGQVQMVQALMAVMAERGLDPTMIYYEGRHYMHEDLPEAASYALQNADIIISETSVLLLYTDTMETLRNNKSARIIMLPEAISIDASPDELYRMMPTSKEELAELNAQMKKVGDKLTGEHDIHFSAANGTDISLKIAPFEQFADGGILLHDGAIDQRGKLGLFPPGSIVTKSVDGSINGKLVVDAENSLYVGLYPDAATLTFRDGALISIEGDGISANLMRKYMDSLDSVDETNNMPEFGMGFNKKAQLNGNFSEGEMIYGCVHVGIGGDLRHHTDTIVPKATVEVDGELILKDGEYL